MLLDKSKARVHLLDLKSAKGLIMRYEWLPTFGTRVFIAYGLRIDEALVGAVAFSRPYTHESSMFIAGKEYADKMCVLSRGICIPDTPQNSSSFLISGALKLLWKDTKYRIVLAYGDERAGEIGMVYQASNWTYIGKTEQHAEFKYNGKIMHGKTARAYCIKNWLPPPSFNGVEYIGKSPPKHRYIKIIGDKPEIEKITKSLQIIPVKYPKKPDNLPKHIIVNYKNDIF
jgi:hypothetical protein